MAHGTMKFLGLILLNVLLFPVYAILIFLSLFVAIFPIFPTQIGAQNARERLGLNWFVSRLFIAGVFLNYAFYFVEAFLIWPLGMTVVTQKKQFEEFLIGIKTRYGKNTETGFLFVGAHYGNIEIGGQAVAQVLEEKFQSRCYFLAKPARFNFLTSFLEKYRSSRGIHHMWTDRKDLLKAMIAASRSGKSLAFLIDQKPAKGGLFVKFFGKFSAFPVAGLDVGIRAGMPVVHITAQRVFPGYARLIFAEGDNKHLTSTNNETLVSGNSSVSRNEYFDAQLSEKERRVAEIMSAYVGWLEGVIRSHPLQWAWDYKKWSREPQKDSSILP
jgi:lauroyl/myristoyl acyltransferase